ncbi:hypothetical protein [Vallitalea guaymasensis]|uniref:Uncharacterized protein n=1 Tax=Vallitalea guaymasensis TaxID=1185412 RepID=A0A8J8SB26_9FIRM|nr:hypothetical protein [Vallitalea guaymasensis]QUH28298.1 hypothetical protein HYG85_04945 [Vallitalea guaymasensis]
MKTLLPILGAIVPIISIIISEIIKTRFGYKEYSRCKPYNKYKGDPFINTMKWINFNCLSIVLPIFIYSSFSLILYLNKIPLTIFKTIIYILFFLECAIYIIFLPKIKAKNKISDTDIKSIKKTKILLLLTNIPLSLILYIGIIYYYGIYIPTNEGIGLYLLITSIILILIGMIYSKDFYIQYLPKFKFKVYLKDSIDNTCIECINITEKNDRVVLEIDKDNAIKKQYIERPMNDIKFIETYVEYTI